MPVLESTRRMVWLEGSTINKLPARIDSHVPPKLVLTAGTPSLPVPPPATVVITPIYALTRRIKQRYPTLHLKPGATVKDVLWELSLEGKKVQ